jgi:hypothetical protein
MCEMETVHECSNKKKEILTSLDTHESMYHRRSIGSKRYYSILSFTWRSVQNFLLPSKSNRSTHQVIRVNAANRADT